MSATPTGNGYGFAVYSPAAGAVTRFYPHPCRFASQKPGDPYADGPQTPNLIQRLAWEKAGEAHYTQDSHVIQAHDQTFFMPFGLKRPALVTSTSQSHPSLEIQWAPPVAGREKRQVEGKSVELVSFKGVAEKAAVVALDAHSRAILPVRDDLAEAVHELLAWQGGADGAELAQREVAQLEAWRTPAPSDLSPDERHLWRQSETVMRMAQVQENTSGKGLILASLPDGEWYIPWARDMSYATVALARMGHQAEARQALDAYLNARPIGSNQALANGCDYQISTVRYNGDGSEAADRSGQARPNLEFDSWGLALWATGEYMRKYHDQAWLGSPTWRGTVYENLRDHVAGPLMENLEPYGDGLLVRADTSVWEQNDLPFKHYAASSQAAVAGLRAFLGIAESMHDGDTVSRVKDRLSRLEKGFAQAFVRGGRVHGVLEHSPKNDVDASTLEAVNFGLLSDPAQTLDSMEVLRQPSGGYRRVTGDTPYERHEFLWSDFAMARARLATGDRPAAQALIDRTVQRSAKDHNLIPEMYVSAPDNDFPGALGDPTGAIPMVGYGAGVYVMTLLDRSETAPPPSAAPSPSRA